MGHLAKKYYATSIDFQQRGSPHAYSFIRIFNETNTQHKTVYIELIEKIINSQFPDH